MALWVDKYRPRDLNKLTYYKEQANKLASLVSSGDFPHLLFCGPSGSGKRTRIHCLLKEIYGRGVENVHAEEFPFQSPSNKKLQINVVNSNYHIELTPSDVGIYDRVVVAEVIKQMAQTRQLNRDSQKPYKVILLLEAEKLSKEAQHSLRRIMEEYAAICKIILCCESASRIIEPLRSRCMTIRVPAPTDEAILAGIMFVCDKERVNPTTQWLDSLVAKAGGNMRRAICMLEAGVSQHGSNLDKQPVIEPEWETYLNETAKIIMREPNKDGLLDARNRFYELLCRCIPASVIFTNLVDVFCDVCDMSLFSKIVAEAAKYEHSSKQGTKEIFHLEAFAVSIMELMIEQKKLGL